MSLVRRSATLRVVALLAAGALVIAACGDDDDGAAGDDGTSTTATGEAGEGDGDGQGENVDRDAEIVFAECCGATGLDPHNQPGGGVTHWFPIYDRLTYVGTPEDPLAAEISPMVAESWEFSDDGLEMTISLRDDVTFNDGTPVTADAVKASLERAKESGYGAASALEFVDAVEAVDDTTVVLTLSQPDAALPAALGSHAGAIINPAVLDDPAVDLDLAPPPGAGSGPFVVEEFEAGTRVVYARADEDYWDPEANRLAGIELVAQPDPNARLNGLRAGDYDISVLFSRTVPEGDQLAEQEQFENHAIAGRTVAVLWLRHTNEKLSDPRVRQAIAMAVDRQGISEGALDGECVVNEQLWAPGVVGHDPDYENPYQYDVDAARQLLEDAGAEDLSLEFIYPAGASQEVIATVLQAALGEIGIDLQVTGLPPADTIAEFVGGDYDGSVNAIVGQPDVAQVVQADLFDRSAVATGDETIERLADEGRAELDPDARAEIYQEMQDYAITEGFAVPICMATVSWAHSADLIGVDRMPFNWTVQPAPRYLGIVDN